jgi:hypothetical protein
VANRLATGGASREAALTDGTRLIGIPTASVETLNVHDAQAARQIIENCFAFMGSLLERRHAGVVASST